MLPPTPQSVTPLGSENSSNSMNVVYSVRYQGFRHNEALVENANRNRNVDDTVDTVRFSPTLGHVQLPDVAREGTSTTNSAAGFAIHCDDSAVFINSKQNELYQG
jgi:hypothetical protein